MIIFFFLFPSTLDLHFKEYCPTQAHRGPFKSSNASHHAYDKRSPPQSPSVLRSRRPSYVPKGSHPHASSYTSPAKEDADISINARDSSRTRLHESQHKQLRKPADSSSFDNVISQRQQHQQSKGGGSAEDPSPASVASSFLASFHLPPRPTTPPASTTTTSSSATTSSSPLSSSSSFVPVRQEVEDEMEGEEEVVADGGSVPGVGKVKIYRLRNGRFVCELCKLYKLVSLKQVQEHLAGKKHLDNLARLEKGALHLPSSHTHPPTTTTTTSTTPSFGHDDNWWQPKQPNYDTPTATTATTTPPPSTTDEAFPSLPPRKMYKPSQSSQTPPPTQQSPPSLESREKEYEERKRKEMERDEKDEARKRLREREAEYERKRVSSVSPSRHLPSRASGFSHRQPHHSTYHTPTSRDTRYHSRDNTRPTPDYYNRNRDHHTTTYTHHRDSRDDRYHSHSHHSPPSRRDYEGGGDRARGRSYSPTSRKRAREEEAARPSSSASSTQQQRTIVTELNLNDIPQAKEEDDFAIDLDVVPVKKIKLE